MNNLLYLPTSYVGKDKARFIPTVKIRYLVFKSVIIELLGKNNPLYLSTFPKGERQKRAVLSFVSVFACLLFISRRIRFSTRSEGATNKGLYRKYV